MKNILLKKTLRELKLNIAQFISIFILIVLGITIYVGFNTIGDGMKKSSENYYNDCNLADIFIYKENITNEDINKLKDNKKIQDIELRFQYDSNLKNNTKVVLETNFVVENNISSIYLIEGKEYNQNLSGVWLDYEFAKENNFNVGDNISYELIGNTYNKEILGLIMQPEYLYAVKDNTEMIPNHSTYGYMFLSSKELEKSIPFNQLLIKTTLSKNELIETYPQFTDNKTIIITKDELPSVKIFKNEIAQMQAIKLIFPIIFLVVAILTVLTTMTRIVINQRLQIGVLKAIGFSNRKIIFHYMSFGLLVSILGSIIGFLLGIMLLPDLLFNLQKTMYSMPYWTKTFEPFILIIILFCVACCSFCGGYTCYKEMKGCTADILRPKQIKNSKQSLFETTKWWSKMTFDIKWNLRDCFKSKLRSFITIFGIMGCLALILCGLGLKDSINNIIDIQYKQIYKYETKVTLSDEISLEQYNEVKNNSQNQLISEIIFELETENNVELLNGTIISDGDLFNFKAFDNYINIPEKGVFISKKTSQNLELKKGDNISIKVFGTNNYIDVEIIEIVDNPISQGIFMSQKAFEEFNLPFKATSFVTLEDAFNFKSSAFSSVLSKNDMIETMNEFMSIINVVIFIMIFAAVLLGVVVLYNLGVLSFFERTRELATLKVLGFNYKRLSKLLQMQNIWLTILGIILGIPVGYLLLYSILIFMGDNFDIQTKISTASILFSILGTFLLSIFVSRLLSLKLKTINMVSALKSIE